jgi:hypothetical protein
LPALFGIAWLGSLLGGAVQDGDTSAARALPLPVRWLCVAMIVFGALPAVGITIMLRQGAPLTPRLTAALSVLAAAGLANVGACVASTPEHAVTLVWRHHPDARGHGRLDWPPRAHVAGRQLVGP